MWKNFRFLHICHEDKFDISLHDKFFSTYLICDICDKYQVWTRITNLGGAFHSRWPPFSPHPFTWWLLTCLAMADLLIFLLVTLSEPLISLFALQASITTTWSTLQPSEQLSHKCLGPASPFLAIPWGSTVNQIIKLSTHQKKLCLWILSQFSLGWPCSPLCSCFP